MLYADPPYDPPYDPHDISSPMEYGTNGNWEALLDGLRRGGDEVDGGSRSRYIEWGRLLPPPMSLL